MINLLKSLDNIRNFSPDKSPNFFSSYKETTIQLLLKPFEKPVSEIARTPEVSDLLDKQTRIKAQLNKMKTFDVKDEQTVISPSTIQIKGNQ